MTTTTATPNMTYALLEKALEFLPSNEGPGPRSAALVAIDLAYDTFRKTADQVTRNHYLLARSLVQSVQAGRALSAREFIDTAKKRSVEVARVVEAGDKYRKNH